MSDDAESGVDELPVVDGSIYGAASFVAGYFTTLLLVLFIEDESPADGLIESAGWIYYNAQFVAIEHRGFAGPETGGGFDSINYLTGQGMGQTEVAIQLPAVIYHAVPVLALVTGGFALARTLGVTDVVQGLKVGASITFGVVLVALGGTYLFEVGNALGPDRIYGVLLAGLAYPLVCGAVGGILAVVTDR